MKMVDEKGKLFGKINIIDLLVLILVLAALALVGWKVIGNRIELGENKPVNVTFVVRTNGIEPTVGNEIFQYVDKNSGLKDQIQSNGDMMEAYVVDIKAIPHVNYTVDAEGNAMESVDSGPNAREDLFFTIEAELGDAITSKLGSQEIRVGRAYTLKTVNFELTNGIIYSRTDNK